MSSNDAPTSPSTLPAAPKASWKSGEFWLTVLTASLGLLVLKGWITSGQEDLLVQAVEKIAGGVIMAWPVVAQIKSRTAIKVGHTEAVADVLKSQ